ncbi:hypothetical protein CL653_00715 [bacterium]|nr:hypothetical protein [bacterium]|tara:strand:+ start:3751 stop:4038 length:288 start_codon:yes stop_codon:yes gene_type:complete
MARGEGVKKLNDLFSKYKSLLQAPEASVKKEVIQVVDDLLQISVNLEDFEYKPFQKTLYCRAKGMVKNEIMLHKDDILNHLKGRLGEKNAPKTIV